MAAGLIYRLLLLAFPPAFRRRFGADMTALFADRRQAARARGRAAVGGLWLRTIADVLAHGLAERRATRSARRIPMFAVLRQHVFFGLRSLWRTPGTTATAILTLALGIGASTAVFSVADALVLRALPYPGADRLVALTDDNAERDISVNVALPNFDDWRASVDAIEAAAAWRTADVNIATAAGADRVSGAIVTEDYFDIMGVAPIAGRTFGSDARADGMPRVAVISEAAWRRLFGGRPDVVGSPAVLDGVPHDVIGIVPTVAGQPDVEIWRPVARTGLAARRTSHGWVAVARLRPGITIDQARARFDVVAARLAAAYPDSNAGWRVGLTPLQETLGEDLDAVLALVAGVTGVLLLIACTNVAGLLVVRAHDRRREFAVRAALGAPRRRIIGQLLTESVMLSLAGAAAGLVAAVWISDLIVSLLPADVALWREPALSVPVLAFATGVSVATGLLFGLAPALASARHVSAPRLRESSTGTPEARRLRQTLVVVQFTLASVLLVGTGLLLGSLWRAINVDPGFDPRGVLTFQVTPPRHTHADAAALTEYFGRLADRVAALPAVEAVGAINSLPMADNDTISTVRRVDEPPPARGEERWALHQVSTPGYLRASGTRLLAGRDFADTDTRGAARVVIVNESLARELWPGSSPLGRAVVLEPDEPHTVVGVIADVRHFGFDQTVYRQYFVPLRQSPVRSMSFALRLRGSLQADDVRRALAAIDPTVPAYDIRTLDDIASRSLSPRRGLAVTVTVCGLAAALLAAIGVYGVVAATVRERRREIGIRLALGAGAGRVVRRLVRGAALLAAVGVAAGLVASYWTAGLIREFLFGVEALDVATLTAASAALVAVSLAATWLPARRAARIDPIEALRYE